MSAIRLIRRSTNNRCCFNVFVIIAAGETGPLCAPSEPMNVPEIISRRLPRFKVDYDPPIAGNSPKLWANRKAGVGFPDAPLITRHGINNRKNNSGVFGLIVLVTLNVPPGPNTFVAMDSHSFAGAATLVELNT